MDLFPLLEELAIGQTPEELFRGWELI